MTTPLSRRQQAQNYMRQAFHGSNNQASHWNHWVQRFPGNAGVQIQEKWNGWGSCGNRNEY
jgi:hypothetical protein